MPPATTTGWSVSRLAAEGLGDRRALGRALRSVEPIGTGDQGEKLYSLRDVVRVLARREVEGETVRLQRQLRALEGQLAGVDARVTETEARRRKRVAEAALLELALAEKRGELGHIADLEFSIVAIGSAQSQSFLGMSAKLALDLAAESTPTGCQALVHNEVLAALEAFSTVKVNTQGNAKLDELLARHRAEIHALLAEQHEGGDDGSS